MDIPILFENDRFCAINKPAGIVVNRASTVHEETIQDWAEKSIHFENTSDPAQQAFRDRAGIVHRIDKETSGILLIAKTNDTFLLFQRAFFDHVMEKTYTAFVHGKVTPAEGEINAPVGRLPWNKEQFGIVPGGKESLTRYVRTSIRTYADSQSGDTIVFSVVDCFPKTGRTHQIRVHMKYIGHPILGDYLYAGRKTSRSDRVWAGRVMLHARGITIPAGVGADVSQGQIHIEAPLPGDMQEVLDASRIVPSL